MKNLGSIFGKEKLKHTFPKPEITNLWDFPRCDPRFGHKYPGRMPGQIVVNLLYYFTEERDLIVDPFAGSGTTIDAVKSFGGREVLAYDIEPCRDDIKKWDITEGYHPEIANDSVTLLILDPPYWKAKIGRYTKDERQLAEVSLPRFLLWVGHLIKDSYKIVKPNGFVALIIDTFPQGKKPIIDLSFECYKLFLSAGFEIFERISVPYRNKAGMTGFKVARARKSKYMLRGFRDLMVFQKRG